MKRLTATIFLTIAVFLANAREGWRADFQKGADAYRSGDYATALREWKPLAEEGGRCSVRSRFDVPRSSRLSAAA